MKALKKLRDIFRVAVGEPSNDESYNESTKSSNPTSARLKFSTPQEPTHRYPTRHAVRITNQAPPRVPPPRLPPLRVKIVDVQPPCVQSSFLCNIEVETKQPTIPAVSKSQSEYASNVQQEIPVPMSHL
jgi:hypothetical protein